MLAIKLIAVFHNHVLVLDHALERQNVLFNSRAPTYVFLDHGFAQRIAPCVLLLSYLVILPSACMSVVWRSSGGYEDVDGGRSWPRLWRKQTQYAAWSSIPLYVVDPEASPGDVVKIRSKPDRGLIAHEPF